MPQTQEFLPIVLVRGFDPMATSDETTYYGWNDGTVYPHKLGENFIYEGMLVKFLKTGFLVPFKPGKKSEDEREAETKGVRYEDATNAICYTSFKTTFAPVAIDHPSSRKLQKLLKEARGTDDLPVLDKELGWLSGAATLDPGVASRFVNVPNSLWVYRFYDFKTRDLTEYARQLARVIEMVKAVTRAPAVNLICHSMGGLIARYLIQRVYSSREEAEGNVNKLVTLGTPHRGIAFQGANMALPAELEFFNEGFLRREFNLQNGDLGDVSSSFDPKRVLCVVGTNHHTYISAVSTLNQLVSWLKGQEANHSDGLVKQESALLTGAYRADVHKCHGGSDSLITSREAFELATRFFFGDTEVTIRVKKAKIHSRKEGLLEVVKGLVDGVPEYYLGFSLKPRDLDFYLHYQKEESENCFGPFSKEEIDGQELVRDSYDPSKNGVVFEGFLHSALGERKGGRNKGDLQNLVVRFDVYVAERDSFFVGHSDTKIVNAQSYFKIEAGDPPQILFIPDLGQNSTPIKATHSAVEGENGSLIHRYALSLDQEKYRQNVELELEIDFRYR